MRLLTPPGPHIHFGHNEYDLRYCCCTRPVGSWRIRIRLSEALQHSNALSTADHSSRLEYRKSPDPVAGGAISAGRQSPDECWNVLGLAVRIASGLELHRPPPEGLDCLSKEVHKRVSCACYGFDQLLSMIYGRPTATLTATSTTPLPEDLDDDLIHPNKLLHPSVKTPSSMSFSIQVSKLYRLLESASSLSDLTLEYLAKLDEEFEAWCSEVPASLKVQDGVRFQDDKPIILALRANMVRILISSVTGPSSQCLVHERRSSRPVRVPASRYAAEEPTNMREYGGANNTISWL